MTEVLEGELVAEDTNRPTPTPTMSWRKTLADDMRTMMDRSAVIRSDVHSKLFDQAMAKVQEILNTDITEKTISTIANTAMRILEFNKAESPTMNFTHVSQQMRDDNSPAATSFQNIELTSEQVMEATRDAVRCQLQIAEWRGEQDDATTTTTP
jgi:hypothetical protein